MATEPGDHEQPTPKKEAHTGPIPSTTEFTPDELQQLEEAEQELLPQQPTQRRPTMHQPTHEISDPSIDLGLPTPSANAGEPSGVSFIQWSKLADETMPLPEADKGLSINSESDADIHLHGDESSPSSVSHPVLEEAGFPVLDLDALEKASPGEPVAAIDDESVDLGVLEGEVVDDELVPEVVEEDDEVIDLDAAAVDDEVIDLDAAAVDDEVIDLDASAVDSGVIELGADEMVEEYAEVLPADSAVVDFGDDAVLEVEEVAEDSGVVQLGANAAVAKDSGAIDLKVEPVGESSVVKESGVIDLKLEQVKESSVVKESGVIDLKLEQVREETIDLGAASDSNADLPTHDLIGEAVESGVDILEVEDEVVDLPLEPVNEMADEPAAEDLDPLLETTLLPAHSEVEDDDPGVYEEIGNPLEGDEEEVLDVPLEEIDADAVDLGGVPENPTEWTPSGIDAPEEVDLEGLPGAEASPSVSRMENTSSRGKRSKVADLFPSDAEEIDLGATMPDKSLLGDEDAGVDAGQDLDGLETTDDSTEALDLDAEDGVDLIPLDGEEDEVAPVAAGDEDPDESGKRAKPAKARSRTPAWVGGTLIGAVLGAGTLGALTFFNVIPALSPQGNTSKVLPVVNNPPVQTGPVLTAADYLKNGDYEKAAKAGIETVSNNDPGKLALRGQYRLENYLAAKGKVAEPIKATDPKLKEALDDLQKAESTPDGLFQLARAQELAGLAAEAKASYEKGEKTFKNDPRFRYGILRLEALRPDPAASPPGPKEKESGRLPLSEEQALAIVLVTLLEDPKPDPNPKPAAEDEAGFPFWEAVKLAREQNYTEAIKKLELAQQLHTKRRFGQLHKQQNPGSDPNEEIFLSSVKELKQYWAIEEQLRSRGYLNLADRRDPILALNALVKELNTARTADLELGKKLVDAKIIAKPEELSKGVDTLLADRTTDRDKVADLEKNFKTAMKEAEDAAIEAKNQLATVKKDLEASIKAVEAQLVKAREETSEREKLLKTLQTELVNAKYVDPKAERGMLVAGLKEALKVANMKDPTGALKDLQKQVVTLMEQRQQEATAAKMELAAQAKRLEEIRKTEVAALNKVLAIRRPPGDLLPLWLPRLQENISPEQAQGALADANAASTDPESTPVTKARAEVIQGLALRNQGQFTQAQKPLTDAVASLPMDDKVWFPAAKAGLADVSVPAKFYASRVDKLRDQGQLAEARQLLDGGIKALPENATLWTDRALLLVEMAGASLPEGSTLSPANPLLRQARGDAAEAIKRSKDDKALKARAHFAAGRAFEAGGSLADAVTNYRTAVGEWPTLDAQGSRYQAALARVLSQPRIGRPAPPKEKEEPEEKETSRLPMLQDLMRLARNPKTENEARQLLLVLVATSLQPGLPMTPGRIEAIKLANDIISQHDKDPKSVPFDVLAEAYSIKGLWTRALVVYVKGLRPYVRNDYYQGLLTLVSNHPQLKRPESLNPPNPIEAENHYAQGLTFYYAGNYADAERQFKLATEYFSEDARYFYFLGLTRLMLGKPEAAEDFEQGAKLEKQNKPTSADISTSLERVQGAPRRLLNEARKNLP